MKRITKSGGINRYFFLSPTKVEYPKATDRSSCTMEHYYHKQGRIRAKFLRELGLYISSSGRLFSRKYTTNMQPSKKFAFDVSITFLASIVSLPLGFVITIALGRYHGAGDLGLYRMTSTIYGIAMLFAAFGIPAAMIKYMAEFKNDRKKITKSYPPALSHPYR